jgi:hypothetical protein
VLTTEPGFKNTLEIGALMLGAVLIDAIVIDAVVIDAAVIEILRLDSRQNGNRHIDPNRVNRPLYKKTRVARSTNQRLAISL